MPDLPKYIVLQLGPKNFVLARLPIGSDIYERMATTEGEATARQMLAVFSVAKRKADRGQKKAKVIKPWAPKPQPAPRKERAVRMPKTMRSP